MKIDKILDNIEKLVLEEFDKRDNRDTDKLSIIGDDYNNRLRIAQRLEKLKLIIYPYYKICKYCEEPLKWENVALRGDEIIHCIKKECSDEWSKDFFGEKASKKLEKLNNAISCGISSKGIHLTYKNGKEEWI